MIDRDQLTTSKIETRLHSDPPPHILLKGAALRLLRLGLH
jgi:hypothetical protein